MEKTVAHYHEGQERLAFLIKWPKYVYAKKWRKRNRYNVLSGKKYSMMVELNKQIRQDQNHREKEHRSKYHNEKRNAHRAMIDLMREQAA